MEKYLYFSEKIVRTQAVSTSDPGNDGSVQVFRISDTTNSGADGLFPDVSNFAAGSDIFKSGSIVVDLLVHADHDGNFGSHYGAPVAGTKVRIHPNALSYDGTQDITVLSKAQDPVYGITMSSTDGNNDFDFTQAKPLYTGDAICFPLSRFIGATQTSQNQTTLAFLPHTNDTTGNGTTNFDKAVLTHANDKFHVICNMLKDIAGNNKMQSGMITFADDYNGVYYNDNPAGITDCDLSLDSAD
tara:strand:+ start:869 stop:1597 length:729 start_codon:yes stop_codon:yes gene_type:complete